jgi:hypothetical protein
MSKRLSYRVVCCLAEVSDQSNFPLLIGSSLALAIVMKLGRRRADGRGQDSVVQNENALPSQSSYLNSSCPSMGSLHPETQQKV